MNPLVLSKTRMLVFSSVVIAMYIGLMYLTQSFAFGAIQVRVATALYALAYTFPFLVVPMGAANFLSNFFGSMGLPDMIGGAVVGMVVCSLLVAVRRLHLPRWLVIPVIILIPGLLVPVWLSQIIGVPYLALAVSLCAGQTPPAILGWMLSGWVEKYVMGGGKP